MKILAENKKAFFDYETLQTHEAGIVLFGFEVKAIKTGHVSLKSSYVTVKNNEVFLINALIPPYQQANTPENYDPQRSRKLLLKKSEIRSLIGTAKIKGLTLVALRLYTKKSKGPQGRGKIKLEFAVAKGKRQIDKRETIRKRETDREIRRQFRGR
jgi:SsrA-binding protein